MGAPPTDSVGVLHENRNISGTTYRIETCDSAFLSYGTRAFQRTFQMSIQTSFGLSKSEFNLNRSVGPSNLKILKSIFLPNVPRRVCFQPQKLSI